MSDQPPAGSNGQAGASSGGEGGSGAALGGGNGLPPPNLPMDPAVFAALDHTSTTMPIIIFSIVCMALATVSVSLRVYTRHFLLNRLGADDFVALGGLAAIIALGTITITHTHFGLGSHIYDVSMDRLLVTDFFKFFFLGVVVYNVTLLFVKLSLFLQYYRLADQVPRFRKVFLGTGFVVLGWTVSMIFAMTFLCIPVEGYWDKSVPSVCLSDPVMQLTNSVGNIITDVILLLLPMPILWGLKLPTRQKWGVIGIFSLGGVTCVVSMLRVIFVFEHGPSSDITFDGLTITAWTLAEVTTGIMASSLITLRPLMSKISPAWGSWRSRYGKTTDAEGTANTRTNPKASATDKDGTLNNDEPIQLQEVKPPQQEQKQYQPKQQATDNYRPSSSPDSEGEASRSSSDVGLVVQRPSGDWKRGDPHASKADWGPPPPPPPFYYSQGQQNQGQQQQQQRRAERQQQYQQHRQSRSASYFTTDINDNFNFNFNNNNNNGGQQSAAAASQDLPLRDYPQHRRHASTKSADRIISHFPSESLSSPLPPPPPPKSPWALAAARPMPTLPPSLPDQTTLARPTTSRGGPPPRHAYSRSNSSMRSSHHMSTYEPSALPPPTTSLPPPPPPRDSSGLSRTNSISTNTHTHRHTRSKSHSSSVSPVPGAHPQPQEQQKPRGPPLSSRLARSKSNSSLASSTPDRSVPADPMPRPPLSRHSRTKSNSSLASLVLDPDTLPMPPRPPLSRHQRTKSNSSMRSDISYEVRVWAPKDD